MDWLDINISIHNNTHLFENLIWKLEWQKKLIIDTNFKSENKKYIFVVYNKELI